jgi:hypothetical protein
MPLERRPIREGGQGGVAAVQLPVVSVRWSTVRPFSGADASGIPTRGGVFEVLRELDEDCERLYLGESPDLRRSFVSLCAGRSGGAGAELAMQEKHLGFRFWECDLASRRLEVMSALFDQHVYECGTGHLPGDVACVRLLESG